jgi:hypothetical protein
MSEEKQLEVKSKVIVTEEGFLRATDLEGKFRIADALFKSKMVPKGYENPLQVMAAMEFAVELGLRPFQGLRNIAMIQGQPSIWGELPLALAFKSGQVESITEFVFDQDYNEICFKNKNLTAKPWGGYCKIVRKGVGAGEAFFTMKEAEEAGLLGRNNPWKTYPKIMLQRRARSQVLKTLFPDMLSGVSIAEYDFNFMPEDGGGVIRDVTRSGELTSAKQLERMFDEEAKAQKSGVDEGRGGENH